MTVSAAQQRLIAGPEDDAELVLWPWGFTSTVAPNGAALTTLGRKFAWFNGYEPQVGQLYAGMDLKRFF